MIRGVFVVVLVLFVCHDQGCLCPSAGSVCVS